MQSTNKSIDLLTIGNTIMDLEFHISDEQLTKLGIEKGTMTLIDKYRKDELLQEFGQENHLCCGGSTANSVYIATKLGCNGHHVGVIGNDDIGKKTIEDYQSNNIGESFSLTIQDGDSGCSIVIITPDGERTMLTYLGVSSQFGSTAFIKELINQSQYFFIEGYLLTDDHCFNMLSNELIPHAKTNNIPVIFSLSDAGLVGYFKSRFLEIIELGIDIVFCNKSESEAISDFQNIDDIQLFFKNNVSHCIVTDGQNGAYQFDQDGITHFPTDAIQPIDTTGAGDAFAGAYIYGMVKQQPKELIGQLANKTANIVISQMGARPNTLDSLSF